MFCPVPLSAFCPGAQGSNSNYDTDDESSQSQGYGYGYGNYSHGYSDQKHVHTKGDAAGCSSTAEETTETSTDNDTEYDDSSPPQTPSRGVEAIDETAPTLVFATPDTIETAGSLRFGSTEAVSPVRPRAALFEKSVSRMMLLDQQHEQKKGDAATNKALETENGDGEDYKEAIISPFKFILLAVGIALIHSYGSSGGIVHRTSRGDPAALSLPLSLSSVVTNKNVNVNANANHAASNTPRAPVVVGDNAGSSLDELWLFHNKTGSMLASAASKASTATKVASKKILEATTGASAAASAKKTMTTTTNNNNNNNNNNKPAAGKKQTVVAAPKKDEPSSVPTVPAAGTALWSYLAGSSGTAAAAKEEKKVQFFPLFSGLDRYLENRVRAAVSGIGKASGGVRDHRNWRAGKRDLWKGEQRQLKEQRSERRGKN